MSRFASIVAIGLSLASSAWAQPVDLRNPRTEAEYLAIETTGLLIAPQELADQFESDIASIRSAYPEVANIHVFPRWMPGDVRIDMTRDAYNEYKAGAFDGFDSLFTSLGTPDVRLRGEHPALTPGIHLSFAEVYHGQRLADLFANIDGVTAAYPNGTVGDGDDIDVLGERQYEFSHGFGDCPAGCTGRTAWRFSISDGGILQLSLVPEPATSVYLATTGIGLLSIARRRMLHRLNR